MGTRNLTVVIKDGNVRVAQYCQWDGYPSGQGIAILRFLKEKYDPVEFERNLAKTIPIHSDTLNEYWKEAGAVDGMATLEVSEKFKEKHLSLHRDTGGDILEIIQDNPGTELFFDFDYGYDSLWCEWAYVVDLDKTELEVYGGFNKAPLASWERWFKAEATNTTASGESYYGVRKIIAFPFMDLPEEDDFIQQVEEASNYYESAMEIMNAIGKLEKTVTVDDKLGNSLISYLYANVDELVTTLYEED